ncbi:MAG: hypothetical protein A3D31_11390 [Candidatus Fluviicola riflensis]|nr:MAG: hypothetical protein CHH17_15815 [Candidatus Fluviicola riflensis]OGS77593.1 MAG: hypothetical protein A3D31_11390 [Candidatus Fluviicola riflensis]OGS84175.1 MAG: hypothetical protein A3E30_12795 [Fluviicola sp. RIFCSPHIGHO2_12_FULL_43_24]OGS84659.1 MAG: hypothetical protein A2724_08325 [Fluviicola sp. RIFCSPHIGHO2_01_FULL_43_53]
MWVEIALIASIAFVVTILSICITIVICTRIKHGTKANKKKSKGKKSKAKTPQQKKERYSLLSILRLLATFIFTGIQ